MNSEVTKNTVLFIKTTIVGAIICFIVVCVLYKNNTSAIEKHKIFPDIANKKVLYINSYHIGYEWSDGIRKGIREILKIDDPANALVIFKEFNMDTKRHKNESFKKDAALKAKKIIDSWHPDLIMVSDDNAIKYLVEPYLNNSKTPVVFCGANWDISRYKLTTNKNITGIIEISYFNQIIDFFKPYKKINTVGYLSFNTISEQEELNHLIKNTTCKIEHRLVNNFKQWQTSFLELNNFVDLIIIDNHTSGDKWNNEIAKKLIYQNLKIPSGSVNSWMIDYNMITLAKSAKKHGEHAALIALKILTGTKPKDIPVSIDKSIYITLNMKLINKLNYKIPIDILNDAKIISK